MSLVLSPTASRAFGGAVDIPGGYEFRVDNGALVPYATLHLPAGGGLMAQRSAMMSKAGAVELDITVGDGKGFRPLRMAWAAVSRRFTGEDVVMDVFRNPSTRPAMLQLKAPFPGDLQMVNITALGEPLVCRQGAFIAAPLGTKVSPHIYGHLAFRLFGDGNRQEFLMQDISGPFALISGHGGVSMHKLNPGERLDVLTGHLLAHSAGINLSIARAGSVASMAFGQKGLILASAEGPGYVWVQSMHSNRGPRVVV